MAAVQAQAWSGWFVGGDTAQTPAPAVRAKSPKVIRASYDAARSSNLMDRHWANADMLAANAANSPAIARVLRARSRYEWANNGFVQRMVLTAANDVIGTTPRLQMNTPSALANRFIESQVNGWSKVVHLGARLRLAYISRKVDGAGLVVKTFNPGLKHALKLGLRVVDVDRLHTPDLWQQTKERLDGLKYDRWGNLVSIDLLRDHPHADYASSNPMAFDTIAAQHVIYWICPRRPEQDRMVPENVAVLQLCGQRRRFAQSVLTASEIAAQIAGVVRTTSSTVEGDEEDMGVGDTIELEMGQFLTLAKGWTIDQMDAKQPTTTYAMYCQEMNEEQAHAYMLPLHKATGNYSKVNYSSGRLGHLDWQKVVAVERHDLGEQHLTPLFIDLACELSALGMMPQTAAFGSERRLPYVPALQAAAGYADLMGRKRLGDWLRGGIEVPTLADLVSGRRELHAAGYSEAERLLETLPHEWFWDAPGEVDPIKETTGKTLKIAAGLSHRRRELSELGIDIDTHDEQAAKDLGLSVEEYRKRLADKLFGPDSTETTAAKLKAAGLRVTPTRRRKREGAFA